VEKIFSYVLVQTQRENSKYKVIDDVKHYMSKRRWLVLEDIKTGIQKTIPIGYYAGNKRCIISENILKDSDGCSSRYVVTKIIDEVILVENEW
jgi:hypothetical protein